MRHVARVGMVLSILFAGIVLPGATAQACSCVAGDSAQYFKWADANVQPQGTRQPQPANPGSTLPSSQTQSATPMQPGAAGAQGGKPMEHK